MSLKKILHDQVLVICTRNRHQRLQELFINLSECSSLPYLVIVVDSSEMPLKDEDLLTLQTNLGVTVRYVLSDSGLPFQRNIGLDEISQITTYSEIKVCHFLDDDVSIRSEYFDVVARIYGELNPVALGSFDINLPNPSVSPIRKLLGLAGDRQGQLLKSGIAIAPALVGQPTEVDWLPGHSVAYRWPLVRDLGFNSSLRMYGEDVDVCMRLRKYGKLFVHPEAYVWHSPEVAGRDASADVQSFSSGFRWKLAKDYPSFVSKRWALITTAALIVGGLYESVRGRMSSSVWRGQLIFLSRLILRTETQQLVERDDVAGLPRQIRTLNESLFIISRH